MTTADPMELLKRIIDAYDAFTAAEIDLGARGTPPYRTALADRITQADALLGRRRERGPVVLKNLLGSGWE